MTTSTAPRTIRVAAYCRKSHAQGLEQEFNSIDAQRQAIECFVASQRGAGWKLLNTDYSDGGYSGAMVERPGFQRLLSDVASGRVDCIAVYRLDRLSRSIMDYLSLLKLFEKHGVTFISVTEQFNTTTPVGRLVLNQLILFSQFEREVISERIRDKVRATRRRGAWTGGRPVLGYDVVDKKLVVNADEAAQVRETYQLYVQIGSLREVLVELRRRGWTNKAYLGKRGQQVAGHAFTKSRLHGLLTNALYTGQMRAGADLVPGDHEPIVNTELWDAVQARLKENGKNGGSRARNRTNALLRELIRCGRCGSAMIHTFTTRGTRRHRYYACSRLHNEGADACPGARVAAGSFEQFVLDQVRVMGTDEALIAKTAEAADRQAMERREQLNAERRRLEPRLRGQLPADERTRVRQRLAEVQAATQALDNGINVGRLRVALAAFQPVWDQLFHAEKERILRLLIERITYHPDGGDVDIELRPCGIQTLAAEAEEKQ